MEPLLTKSDTIPDKIAREGALVAGAAQNVCDGIRNAAQDAWNKPERCTKLITDAAVGGLAIALIAKNPAILGKGLQPVCEFGIAHGGKIGTALLATDLSQRIASPVIDTWRSADGLSSNKQLLGDRLGAAVVDYTLLGAAGLAGAKYGPAGLNYCRDFIGKNLIVQPAYAFAGATTGVRNLQELAKPWSTNIADKPSAKELMLLNQGKGWSEIKLTGNTHVAEQGQWQIEGEKGDIVLHAPGSDKNYIGVKLLDANKPRVIPALRNFDIRDVLDKSHINFGSDEQRLFNLQVIKEAVSNLKGELVLRRDVRHHKMDFSDEWVQYRLRSPHWVDPLEEAPLIRLPLSGRVSEYEPVRPRRGDLYVSTRLDRMGAANKDKGSGPQSGQFFLNGYDDYLWSQKFNLRGFLVHHTNLADPGRLFTFDTKEEMLKKLPHLVETLQEHIQKDDIANWNHNPKKRMFEIQ